MLLTVLSHTYISSCIIHVTDNINTLNMLYNIYTQEYFCMNVDIFIASARGGRTMYTPYKCYMCNKDGCL